ncbi:hypothetical protein ABMA27_010179, partial [Loxostege sticticalis]
MLQCMHKKLLYMGDAPVNIVVWYLLDTREGRPSHWSDSSTLGVRATFRSDTVPAVLVLTKLRPYQLMRCLTHIYMYLFIIRYLFAVPPERLIILNQDGNEIRSGVIGPYDEGTEVNLTCVAVGGRPTARVSWWKSHALLANSEARASVSFRLQRSDYGTDITCQVRSL